MCAIAASVKTAAAAISVARTAMTDGLFLSAWCPAATPGTIGSTSPQRGTLRYRGVGPRLRRRTRGEGGGPGRTAIHRKPAGSFGAARC